MMENIVEAINDTTILNRVHCFPRVTEQKTKCSGNRVTLVNPI